MRTRAPRAVADLLPTALPDLAGRLIEREIRRAWPALVGPDAARRTQARALENGCLTIVVDNSPWLHELTLRREEFLARVAERFDGVRALRLVLGPLEPAEPGAVREAQPRAAARLDAAALSEIDAAAAAIPDPTLAAAARRLLTKAWRAR
jgi:hypothetical protein